MVSFADKPIHDFTVEQWEAFLAAGPDDGGVRLKLRKKLSKAPGITWQEALEVALCYGWIDGQSARFDDDYMLQAFTPRRKNSPWSQINVGHVARLIEEGRMQPGGLAEIERAKADGRWDAAYRVKDAVVPADLQAALDANPAAFAFFEAMKKQERFQVIFRITGIKTPAIRAARIRDVVEKAARGEHHYK
ncbi:YdeI family protein [Pseudoclavibacter sp. RFBA6]|uniref:YdeI/OmpD-associated family protein n=1 Tax=Pseudoclavibacter sp. RFBA6 TaxID=2080573 RepID=UPI000CE734C5|nr:YdeI/OmpD-associated family protein [Pseudoclavibacter sp. RFBA6]PPG43238.1 bacteriocin-protection protein, YdeI/OmpD-associated family [Pseudoclavibacter sp. RFBA6]